MLGSLHDKRDAGVFAFFDQLIDLILKVKSASKQDGSVKIAQIGKFKDVEFSVLYFRRINIYRVAEEQKNVDIIVLEGILHARKEL